MKIQFFCALTVLMATSLLPGCGPGVGDVSGVVTYQGKPVTGATVMFFDEKDNVTSSEVDAAGAYKVTKVRAGTARITVALPLILSVPGAPANKMAPIPLKYADHELSGLTCKVGGGSQKHNIDLE